MEVYTPYEVDVYSLDKESQKRYIEQVLSLSNEIKKIIFSPNTVEFIKNIVIRANLNEEQGKEISRAIRDLLMSKIKLDDFEQYLISKLGPETAKIINNEVTSNLITETIKQQLTGAESGNTLNLRQ